MSKNDFNATINLPKTDFPMRAGLAKREPEMLQHWYDMDLYHEMLKKNDGKPRFSLHDGPPFSNGDIHMGHAPQQGAQGLHHPLLRHARLLHALHPRLGQPRHAHRERIIKSESSPQGMSIADFRSACHDLCAEIHRPPDGRLQAHGRHGRLGAPLQDHEQGLRVRRGARVRQDVSKTATSTRA